MKQGRTPQSDRPDEKLASAIAREIEERVVELGWPVGHRLGREPELIERYKCSRQVIREAIRLLEFHGVARMRTGPGGGLFVTSPDARSLARGASLFLDYAKVDIHHVFNLRRRLEVDALDLAIDALDEAGEARLLATLAADDVRTPGTQSVETEDIHSIIAELSGNPALALFIGVLVSISQRRYSNPEIRAQIRTHSHPLLEHRRLVAAIIARDKARACAVLVDHLDHLKLSFS